MIRSEVYHSVKYVKITANTLEELFKMVLSYQENQEQYRFLTPPRMEFDSVMEKYEIELYFVPKER